MALPSSQTIIDRSYALHESIGQGGMGTVFRATQLVSGLPVALKLVSHRSADPLHSQGELVAHRLALSREFQTLASLQHENVIRVLSYGFDDSFGPYYTMELLESPKNILEAACAKSNAEKVQLIAQLLRALVYLHARGVLHRDIKPGNVLCCHGEVKLLDFGIAVDIKAEAELAGTVEYMAPELLLGHPPSVSSELYSVGVLGYQIFTNQLPFDLASVTRMLEGILGTRSDMTLSYSVLCLLAHYGTGPRQPLRPKVALGELQQAGIEEPLAAVLERLLARDPTNRYASAQIVLGALAAATNLSLPVETTSTRESFLQATRLVGREAELNELRQALSASRKRQGGGVLIGGESGVGKSRLISELRTLALVNEAWVAECQCTAEGGSPYHEWHSLVRALCFRVELSDAQAAVLREFVPDLGQLLGRELTQSEAVAPQDKQARLGRTLAELLSRLDKPLLLLFEDLQWARSESLELLTQLVPMLSALPVLLVGTYRLDEAPMVAQLLQPVRLIHLQRLHRADITRLSQDLLGAVGQREDLVAYLERQTEGNAFFLVEVLRALAESAGALGRIGEGELPETVLTAGIAQLLERRLEQTSPAYHGVLEFLAVAGREIDLRILEGAFPTLEQRSFLLQCANTAMLEAQGRRWRFAHDKLRETLLRHLPAEKRKRLHGRVAEAMERVYDREELEAQSAVLAYHHEQAGQIEQALPYAIKAGDLGTSHGLYKEPRGHYATAQALLAQLPERSELERLKIDLLLKQVQAGLLSDTRDVQSQRVAQARALLETLRTTSGLSDADRLRLARVDYYQGRLFYYSGQAREAIQHYQRVLPVAREFGDRELLVLPASVIGMALMMQGQFRKGCELLDQIVEPLRYIAPAFDWIRVLLAHAMTRAGIGEYQAACERMPAIYQHAQATNQVIAQVLAHLIHGVIHRLAFDWPAAIERMDVAVELSHQVGDKMYIYLTHGMRAFPACCLGRHEQALADREVSLQISREMGGRLLYADWFEAFDGELPLRTGWPVEALERARAMVAASSAAGLVMSHGIGERLWGEALLMLAGTDAGPREEACAHFNRSVEVFESGGLVLEIARSRLVWGQALHAQGETAAATELLRQGLVQLRESGCRYALLQAERMLPPSVVQTLFSA